MAGAALALLFALAAAGARLPELLVVLGALDVVVLVDALAATLALDVLLELVTVLPGECGVSVSVSQSASVSMCQCRQ